MVNGSATVNTMDRLNRLQHQNYDELKTKCLKSGVLFEDDIFPPSRAFYKLDSKAKIKWARPMEIALNSKFYLDASAIKMVAGDWGCLWLVGVFSALVTQHNLLEWVVPLTQAFESNYAGIFYFRIWYYGKWNSIVVDDRLPTVGGKPIRLHDKSLGQFWCSLLEKAYAKLLGCYDVLSESNVVDALEDFTGGLVETYKMPSELRPGFFNVLFNSLSRFSLLIVYVESEDKKKQQILENGLVTNTAYVLNSLHMLEIGENDSQIQFVGLKNTFNNSHWRGSWRVNAPEWYLISEDDRDKFDRNVDFWMLYADFCITFSRLCICNVVKRSESIPRDWDYQWSVEQYENSWEASSETASQEALLKSPKFIMFRTQEAQTGDIVIGLMQTYRKIKDAANVKLDLLNIGFVVYALNSDNDKKIEKMSLDSITYTHEWFTQHKPFTKMKFTSSREVVKRFTAKPGNYLIVPCSEVTNKKSTFLLRIFQEILIASKAGENVSKQSEAQLEQLRFLIPATVEIFTDSNQQMLDAFELEVNLRKNLVTPTVNFSLDQCRSLIALFDERKEGKMSVREFNSLCTLINIVYETFRENKKETKDILALDELHTCLVKLGFELNRSLLELLMSRYGSTKQGSTGLDFVNLVICTIRLQNVFLYWHNKKHGQIADNPPSGLSFSLPELLEQIIYS